MGRFAADANSNNEPVVKQKCKFSESRPVTRVTAQMPISGVYSLVTCFRAGGNDDPNHSNPNLDEFHRSVGRCLERFRSQCGSPFVHAGLVGNDLLCNPFASGSLSLRQLPRLNDGMQPPFGLYAKQRRTGVSHGVSHEQLNESECHGQLLRSLIAGA